MILVSGANGFLGQALIRQLLNKDYKVIGLIFGLENSKSLIKDKNLRYIKLDIRKEKEFKKLAQIKNIKAFFHTAGYIDFGQSSTTFKKCFEVNVLGTLHLLEYCRAKKIKKFIYSSTVNIYNSGDKPPIKESDSILPDNFYSLSKLIGEYLCLYYQQVYGIKISILRYSGLYGWQGQAITALNIFINKAIKGEKILIYGKGKQIRDWTYIEDAAQANIKSLRSGKEGIFNISFGRGLKIKEAAYLIKKIFKSSSRIIFVNKSAGPVNIVYDVNKAKKELKFIPTSLFKALEEIKSRYETNIF